MKNLFSFRLFTAISLCFFASTAITMQASTQMSNYPIDKSSLYYGMDLVAASTFSIEDASSTTKLSTFPLSDVLIYPESATLKMDNAYTEKSSDFGNGGTAESPYYAVTNVASNITSSFNFGDGRHNYLFFHTPASQKSAFAIKTTHKAKTGVNIKATISMVAGKKTKLELWAGTDGETTKIAEKEFDVASTDASPTVWEINEYVFDDVAAAAGYDVTFEIRRNNDYGDDCVFAMSAFYIHGIIEALRISGDQLLAPLGTPLKLNAIYKDPVTKQSLHWYTGERIGGYSYYPELTQHNGQNPVELMPSIGTSYYTVSALGQYEIPIATADTLEVTRYLECSENSKVIWHEDFGILASEDAKNSYEGMQYTYAATGNVSDGKYAITANPRTCGKDNDPVREESDYWFRKIYDHTQGGAKGGEYGGMLLVNCPDGQQIYNVVLEKEITADQIGCPNSKVWMNFSAWFANADWNRGIGNTLPNKMQLRVINATGSVLGSIDVITDVTEGWKRGVVSIEYPGESVTLQIVNYGASGGDNNVLIDDIQFEICRPAIGLVAETLDGKQFDDIKNVRTSMCGGKVNLIADPEENIMDIFPISQGCAYFVWLKSKDGENWDKVNVEGEPWEGYGKCGGSDVDYSKYEAVTIEKQPMYYKAVIGRNSRELLAYLYNPGMYVCYPVVETPAAYVYCPPLRLTIEKEKCNEYEAEVENPEAGHTFKWEYGNEDCGWTVIEGQTGVEIRFDAKAYFEILNNSRNNTVSGATDGGCCNVGIKVTDMTSGDTSTQYVNDIYEPSITANLVSEKDGWSVYKLTASIEDACWKEPVGELFFFYKNGVEISRSEDWNPEYKTEALFYDATYTVRFGGYDELMFCQASVDIKSKNIIQDNIIYRATDQTLSVKGFAEQTYASNLTIPDIIEHDGKQYTVTSIEANAFKNCQHLEKIYIPKTITSIGDKAFRGCTGVTQMSVADGNDVYDSRENCNAIIKTATNKLLYGCNSTIIPKSVTSISDCAFWGCSKLSHAMEIPDGVNTIADSTFYNCSNMPSVVIPSSLYVIGKAAFNGCNLKTVDIYSKNLYRTNTNGEGPMTYLFNCNVSEIIVHSGSCPFPISEATPSYATLRIDTTSDILSGYYGNSWINKVIIENGPTIISKDAFAYCEDISSVILPDGINEIGENAFSNCSRVSSISIPSSVTTISNNAFKECTGLKNITIYTGMQVFSESSLDGCTNITLTFADGITSIEGNAYKNINNISNVNIPHTVSKVGGYAFSNCTNLKKITCMSTTPPSTRFDICSANEYENVILYVPCSSVEAYENDEYWGKFVQIRCIEASTTEYTAATPQVSPGYTTAEITWPMEMNADSYVLTLTIGGNPFCELVFNKNGQLISIDFSNMSTKRSAELRAAIDHTKGYKFTVTGLSEGTSYNYNVTTVDSNGGVINTYTDQFKTLGMSVNIDNETYLNNMSLQESICVNGRLIQTNNEKNSSIKIFNTAGIEVGNPVPSAGVYIIQRGQESIKVMVK